MMRSGLYPIISRDNGITLENGGIYLEDCSVEEISDSMRVAYGKKDQTIIDEIHQTQMYAQRVFNRKNFSSEITRILSNALGAPS
jgi:hypothetical protein